MGIRRLQRAILSNGPHLGSPQWGQKVINFHILGAISKNFQTINMELPVVLVLQKGRKDGCSPAC